MIRAALVLSLLAAPAWAEPARVVALGGTVAEILGPREARRDRGARLHMFRGDLDDELNRYHPRGKTIVEAYVRGVSRIVPDGAAYGYVLKSASDERLKLALRSIFVEAQCVIDREVRGMQQKSLGQVRGFSDSEYEILVDIALGLTDRTIARRRGLSIRSVQNRLQQLYEKLGVYQMSVEDSDEGRFNLRARAVTVALLRKLLNYSALERAEAELAEWLRSH